MSTGEQWRAIEGWPGYEVSDQGQVRSFWTYASGPGTKPWDRVLGPEPKVLAGNTPKVGARKITLTRGDERQVFPVGGLVLEAFGIARGPQQYVVHKNGKMDDDRLENLAWGSRRDVRLTTIADSKVVSIQESDVPVIWERLRNGEKARAISSDLGIGENAVNRIRAGQSWSHVTATLPPLPDATDDELPGEEWKAIDEWPGYEVSNCGRVRSFWGPGPVRENGEGQGRRVITDRAKIIGGYVIRSGHKHVLLYRNNSTEKKRLCIHTLVAAAFIGPRPEGMFVCHKDGNPGDNRVENLYYGTPHQNTLDTLKHGNRVKPGSHYKLKDADISGIWERLVAGESAVSIAKDYGVGNPTVTAIRNGRIWTHVTRTLPGWPLVPLDRDDAGPICSPAELCGGEELWRPIEGWEGYRISNQGRVQTCRERVTGGRRGETRLGAWRDLVLSPDSDGYLVFGVYQKCKGRTLKVHREVLRAFVGEPPERMVACHVDGDKTNNRLSNLRWDTHRSNARDRVRHGREREAVI